MHCKPERANDWVLQLTSYHEAYDEWRPMLKLFAHFSELYHEQSRDYIDWFTAPGRGFAAELSKAEEEQLANWKEKFMVRTRRAPRLGAARR